MPIVCGVHRMRRRLVMTTKVQGGEGTSTIGSPSVSQPVRPIRRQYIICTWTMLSPLLPLLLPLLLVPLLLLLVLPLPLPLPLLPLPPLPLSLLLLLLLLVLMLPLPVRLPVLQSCLVSWVSPRV